jgi:hypothetical protein
LTTAKAVLAIMAALLVAAIAVAIIDPESLSAPDADEREKAVTKCLREADFTVKSEIPPHSRVRRSPQYKLDVSRGGEVVAYIYLFDFPEEAERFVDDAKLDADDRKPMIEQRGATAIDLDTGASTTPAIHHCIDRAAEPPPDSG